MTALKVSLQNDVHKEISALYTFCNDYHENWIFVETYFVRMEKQIYNCPAVIANKMFM